MKTVFIIHGTWGNPEENWFPWMKEMLEEQGYRVFVPAFPTPGWQSLTSWNEAFSEYMKYIDEETIFIAHSVGPAFVLNILENISIKIKACYFVSGFLGLIDIESFDILNNTITHRDFNWGLVKNNCNNFYMCHGSDDPYVPIENAEAMANNLGVEIDMIEWGGHLNEESGYSEFEYLSNKIT